MTVCPQNGLLGRVDQSGEKTSAYMIKETEYQNPRLEIYNKKPQMTQDWNEDFEGGQVKATFWRG